MLSNTLKSLGPEPTQRSTPTKAARATKLEAQTYSLDSAAVNLSKKDVVKDTVNTLTGKGGKTLDAATQALVDMAKSSASIKKSFEELLVSSALKAWRQTHISHSHDRHSHT